VYIIPNSISYIFVQINLKILKIIQFFLLTRIFLPPHFFTYPYSYTYSFSKFHEIIKLSFSSKITSPIPTYPYIILFLTSPYLFYLINYNCDRDYLKENANLSLNRFRNYYKSLIYIRAELGFYLCRFLIEI